MGTYRSNVVTAAPDPEAVEGGAGSISLTITVDADGGEVSIDTGSRAALNPPVGSWPYTHEFPEGQGTTAVIALTTNAVEGEVPASIRACSALDDISDPEDWQAYVWVAVQPQTAAPELPPPGG
jgi:hypothetical protein